MPRQPLTEEQKQVLRDRLEQARAARAVKAKERREVPTPKKPKDPEVLTPSSLSATLYAPWSENEWMSRPIEDCRSRLALLKEDFGTGSSIVGKRPDVNDTSTYRCFVCNNKVPERAPSGNGPGWVWKHDYLDPQTGLFKSIVIDTQTCHTVFVNDTRLQQKLKDLMRGEVGATPVKESESAA
jgi:hypothetical protein